MASKEENTFEKTWNELNNYIKNIGFSIGLIGIIYSNLKSFHIGYCYAKNKKNG
jgi:hypothetical protein